MQTVSNEEIAAALVSCPTVKEAAEQLNISPRTIYNRLRDNKCRGMYEAAKADVIREAVFSLNEKLGAALDTVGEIMTDKSNNPAVRLQAAQTIINNAGKMMQHLDQREADISESTVTRWEDEIGDMFCTYEE